MGELDELTRVRQYSTEPGDSDSAAERLDLMLEHWMLAWQRGRSDDERILFAESYEKEVVFVGKALCSFDPRCLIDVFAARLDSKLAFDSETLSILCTICTIICAARPVQDKRRRAREINR